MMDGKVKVAGVTLGMALNNANVWMCAQDKHDLNCDDWACMMLDYAEALLKEMEKRDLLR